MATVAVTSENREELIREGASILYFTAAWCGPCQQFGPIYTDVSGEFPDVTFGKIDVDTEPELAAHYGIRSIPTLVAHRDGEVIDRSRGAIGVHALRDFAAKI